MSPGLVGGFFTTSATSEAHDLYQQCFSIPLCSVCANFTHNSYCSDENLLIYVKAANAHTKANKQDMGTKLFSHVQLFVTLCTVTRQAALSVGFFRQEYWSGLPRTLPGYQTGQLEPIYCQRNKAYFYKLATRTNLSNNSIN